MPGGNWPVLTEAQSNLPEGSAVVVGEERYTPALEVSYATWYFIRSWGLVVFDT